MTIPLLTIPVAALLIALLAIAFPRFVATARTGEFSRGKALAAALRQRRSARNLLPLYALFNRDALAFAADPSCNGDTYSREAKSPAACRLERVQIGAHRTYGRHRARYVELVLGDG